MPIITDKELPENVRALWLKALTAFETRNYGYTISLIGNILKTAPTFLDGRKLSRKAAIMNTKGKKPAMGGSLSGSLSGITSGFGVSAKVKKDPMAAMEQAEKSLETDPYNRAANDLLKEAARAAGHPEIAVFALETLVQGNLKDTKLLHELGDAYLEMKRADEAVNVFQKIVEINPADLQAVKKGKDAAASGTMQKGGWETAKSYRDVMKNAGEAVSLEQKGRVVRDVDMIQNQLAELTVQYEQQPENFDVVKRMAQLFFDKFEITEAAEDLEQTIQWYEYTSGLAKGADPAVARKLSDLKMRGQDLAIKNLEDWFAQGGDQHPDAAQYRDDLERLKQERSASHIDEARKRVERNPTDLQLRFELGERLLESGNFSDAIPELQRARQNPNVRLKAMSLLGRCFVHKGMLDMAASQFEGAASEMTAMDAVKKDTLYELGLLYERMGQREKYIKCIKDIAEVDYTYKDVGSRIERFYSGEQAA